MSTAPDPAPGSHSGHWGLSAILLGSLVLVLFPVLLAMEGGSLYGAYTDDFLESHHIDMGVTTAYALVAGIFLLAGVSFFSALRGLGLAAGRKQPAGLAFGGLVVGALALVVAVLFLLVTNEGADWIRKYQKHRFGPGANPKPAIMRDGK